MGNTHIEEIISRVSEGVDSVVLYRLPFHQHKTLHLGNAIEMQNLDDQLLQTKGFLIHPFNHEKFNAVWISQEYKYDYSHELSAELTNDLTTVFRRHIKGDQYKESTVEEYKSQFSQLHQSITDGYIDKVILSRIKKVPAFNVDGIISMFDELCELYPHAFVYAFVNPVNGVWLGAGPELLLSKSGNNLSTVSLAGTLPNNELASWAAKEIIEQGIVTDYMRNVLKESGVVECGVKGPYSVDAGQVKHLKTDFRFSVDQINKPVSELLMSLHPTPAVCGMPKDRAIRLISAVEDYQRELYAGFLGPVDEDEFSFFVNIRCMKLTKKYAALYLGGGLTKDSEPDKEWEETELKAQTLLTVLNKVSNLNGYE